jgi:hypothetical protein
LIKKVSPYRQKRRTGDRLPPFVPLPWNLLNSEGYQKLPFAAAKALPYFFGKVKTNFNPQRYQSHFTFSYPEAKRYGFSFSTFSKVIKDLISFGFLDPVDRGGLRGFGKGYNVFKLSMRWENYGRPEFQGCDWKTFIPIR